MTAPEDIDALLAENDAIRAADLATSKAANAAMNTRVRADAAAAHAALRVAQAPRLHVEAARLQEARARAAQILREAERIERVRLERRNR